MHTAPLAGAIAVTTLLALGPQPAGVWAAPPPAVERVLLLPATAGLAEGGGPDAALQQAALLRGLRGNGRAVLEWPQVRRRLLEHLAPQRASADDLARVMDKGRELYLASRFGEAIALLERTEQSELGRLAHPRHARQASAYNALLGVVCSLGGRELEARQRFRLALALEPQHELDAALYPPRVVALFQQVRAELTQSSPTPLHLTVVGSTGATLFVDGRPSSGAVDVAAGAHYVLVRNLGFHDTALRVEAPSARGVTIRLSPLATAEHPAQLAAWCDAGDLDGRVTSHVLAVGAFAGATHVVWWRSGQPLRVGLIDVTRGRQRALRQLQAGDEARVWALLHRTGSDTGMTSVSTPLWRRWWVWAIGSAVVVSAVTSAVVVATSAAQYEIRLR